MVGGEALRELRCFECHKAVCLGLLAINQKTISIGVGEVLYNLISDKMEDEKRRLFKN